MEKIEIKEFYGIEFKVEKDDPEDYPYLSFGWFSHKFERKYHEEEIFLFRIKERGLLPQLRISSTGEYFLSKHYDDITDAEKDRLSLCRKGMTYCRAIKESSVDSYRLTHGPLCYRL